MATTTGNRTVIGLFDSYDDAERCVRELRDLGIPVEDISLVVSDNRGKGETGEHLTTDSKTVAENVLGGALFGGLGGLLIGLGALAIPGLGPIVAAGPIATTLAGAGVGAVGGGIISAIKDAGVPEEEAHIYAEGVRRGGTLVAVHSRGISPDRISEIMDRNGAGDIDERGAQWRSNGWTRFDENAEPYETERSGVSTRTTVGTRMEERGQRRSRTYGR